MCHYVVIKYWNPVPFLFVKDRCDFSVDLKALYFEIFVDPYGFQIWSEQDTSYQGTFFPIYKRFFGHRTICALETDFQSRTFGIISYLYAKCSPDWLKNRTIPKIFQQTTPWYRIPQAIPGIAGQNMNFSKKNVGKGWFRGVFSCFLVCRPKAKFGRPKGWRRFGQSHWGRITCYTWGFPKIGVPRHGWFIMETPIKME